MQNTESLFHLIERKRLGPAAAMTVEALMYSLRERGMEALKETKTRQRLSELSDRQVVEVEQRLQKLNLGRGAWSEADVETLVRLREELRAL
jgi:transposase